MSIGAGHGTRTRVPRTQKSYASWTDPLQKSTLSEGCDLSPDENRTLPDHFLDASSQLKRQKCVKKSEGAEPADAPEVVLKAVENWGLLPSHVRAAIKALLEGELK